MSETDNSFSNIDKFNFKKTETKDYTFSNTKVELEKKFSEIMFKNQKEKIKEIKLEEEIKENEKVKEKVKAKVNDTNVTDLKKDLIMLTLNDKNLWNYSTFDFDLIDGDEVPTIGSNWQFFPFLEKYSYSKGIEIRNIALRSTIDFNYDLFGIELNLNFSLKGEASLWVFSRSSVINILKEGISIEPEMEKNYTNADKYCSIIRIFKEDKSQKCFLSMSVFAEDEKGEKVYKTFTKRQLINYSDVKSNYHVEHDICDFKVLILDLGNEKITNKIFFNDSKIENLIHGDFFLPIKNKAKIIIAGSGQSCLVKNLVCRPFVKCGETNFTTDKKNCDCCLIS